MRLLVVGGGPAGLNAALQGRELGAQVILIESDRLGGTSINRGPAPVRTLARAARLVRDTQAWPAFGLRGPGPQVDLAATLANAGRVADYAHHEQRLSEYVRATGIELVEGTGPARFVDPNTVAVGDGRSWQADRIILAVGGHPGRLPIAGAELGLTYTDLRALTALPGRVAVIGGADTGCQLASILADFGCQTLLLEYAPRLIPRADQDLSAALDAAFTRRGIEAVTGASAERLVQVEGGVEVHYQQADGPARRLVDAVFFAVGWPANLQGLELAAAGVAAERGHIPVNDWLQTNVAHIFAAGDVNGRSMLVPSARHEGRLAAENAVLGTRRRVAHEIVPTGSFTDPEYASVGLPEAQARERYDCAVAVVGYDHLLRAVIDGHAEGFCKLIVERRQRYLLGAHVLGEYSAEVIQVAAVAMAANLRVEQLAELQLAFPTFTEALGMAAQQLVRELGVARMPPSLSELELGSLQDGNDKERHACLEVWSVVILPALLVARRRAGLADRPPAPPAATPTRRRRQPATCLGGPTGRRRGGDLGRAVVPTRRPDGRDLQDRGRRQHGPAGKLAALGFCQPDGTFIATLAELCERLGEMARSGEAVVIDGLATRVQRPSAWVNQKVLYDAKATPTTPRAWRCRPSTVTCCGVTVAGRGAAMSRS